MFEKAITVTQFNTYIKNIFDAEVMLQGISISGEITDLKISNNIAYFAVKDSESMLSCVAFNASEKFLDIENGSQVIVSGSPNYYIKGGRFNFSVFKIEKQGQGILFLEFLRLKEKLEQEGLFKEETKKAIPNLLSIKTIGVITSETGAVIEDIIDVSTRRNPAINILLYPAKVQGVGAAQSVLKGLDYFENHLKVDAVIVARGGGSFEDLSCFNDETLARRVHASKKVIISAIGHETDFTILDFVADKRAPTPSAAAELLTFDTAQTQKQLSFLQNQAKKSVEKMFIEKTNQFFNIYQNFKHKFSFLIENNFNKLDFLKIKLENTIKNLYNQKQQALVYVQAKLDSLNPKSVLERGFAKIEQNDKGLSSVKQIDFNSNIKIVLKDGKLNAKPIKLGEK